MVVASIFSRFPRLQAIWRQHTKHLIKLYKHFSSQPLVVPPTSSCQSSSSLFLLKCEVSMMGLLLKYLRVLVFCFVLMMVGALNSAHSTVLLHFTRAPSVRSRFSTAVFEYSIRRPDGSNACKNNGCSLHCEVPLLILNFEREWES